MPDTILTLSDGTNYIFCDFTDNTIKTQSSLPSDPSTYYSIATIVVSTSTITSITDTRPLVLSIGNAATATKLLHARDIYGEPFDGTADLTGVIASTFGGTGSGFTKFAGPTTSEKTFTLPDADTVLVGEDTTQALTNKDLTDPSNTFPTDIVTTN